MTDLRRAEEAVIEAAHAEALLTEASRVLHRIYYELMISPQGYHPKGAASKAFSIIMDNLEIVTWAWEQDYAAVCRGKPAPTPPVEEAKPCDLTQVRWHCRECRGLHDGTVPRGCHGKVYEPDPPCGECGGTREVHVPNFGLRPCPSCPPSPAQGEERGGGYCQDCGDALSCPSCFPATKERQ